MDLVEHDFLARLRAFVRRRVRSSADADDLVQTVLLRLLEAGGRGSVASVHAWAIAAARTAVVDFHRARARVGATLAESAELHVPEAEEASDIAACIEPLLTRLEPDERELLERVDVRGESQADLARELSLSPSGLKSRVQRARTRLRETLLACCLVERDAHGMPVGPAVCKPHAGTGGCGCAS